MSKKEKKNKGREKGNAVHVFDARYRPEKELSAFLIADAEYRHKKMLMDSPPEVILKLNNLK